ncbi:CPBP family intramembrane glutamic endopeptidase [Microscilla marina]|uniref:Caax amino terminal protease family n=1 Tax=Microscilla marina ATCC 23134 TaxID=313606 RepID=A1ZUR8_MICM2|nr:CPBP family intramembrane glutamic endopeptidase [Microscilla marina]EAY25822.1 caax amino terminal protease family [Microscilla marina ATCC 23134]
MLKKLWRKLFLSTFQKVSQEATPQMHGVGLNNQTIGILTTAILCLVFTEYWGSLSYLVKSLANISLPLSNQLKHWLKIHAHPQWIKTVYWSMVTIVFFLLVPLVYIRWWLKKPLKDFGWQWRATRQDILIYITCLLCMLPLVWVVSSSPVFLAKYPFYQPKPNEVAWERYFVLWQLVYLLQFVAVEFFFRGFILHGIKKQLGAYSIWVAMLPYCMIHFGKPLPETLGAIVAGLILGTFSLKNNSIWLGVLLHYGVAITMDLLALWHKGLLFG